MSQFVIPLSPLLVAGSAVGALISTICVFLAYMFASANKSQSSVANVSIIMWFLTMAATLFLVLFNGHYLFVVGGNALMWFFCGLFCVSVILKAALKPKFGEVER